MKNINYIQNSFIGGEISTDILSRIDLDVYYKSAKRIENMIVKANGGVLSRPGFKFLREISSGTGVPRLIEYKYSKELSYILVFKGSYIWAVDTSNNITQITNASGYTNDNVWNLKTIQNGRIMYLLDNYILTTGSYRNKKVKKIVFDGSSWTQSDVTFSSPTNTVVPTITSGKEGAAGTSIYSYKVCGFNTKTLALSLPKDHTTSATMPNTITTSNYPYLTLTFANTTDRSNFLALYDSYIVYKQEYGIYYKMLWIRDVTTTSTLYMRVNDLGTSLDKNESPPDDFQDFSDTKGYPTMGGFYNNRSIWGNIYENNQKMWFSCIGNYEDLSYSYPPTLTRGLQLTLATNEKNDLSFLEEAGKVVLFTTGSKFRLGDNLSVDNMSIKKQDNIGCSNIKPLLVDNKLIYVSSSKKEVRDLVYDYQTDSLQGIRLSAFAKHLVTESNIIDSTYQMYPYECLWYLREDGMLLGVTYNTEQKVVAWHRHTTNGLFKSIACIPLSGNDILYSIIEKDDKYYLCKMMDDIFETNEPFKCHYLDLSVIYDGVKNSTITLSGVSGSDITVVSDEDDFASTDVDRCIFIPNNGYGVITEYVDINTVKINVLTQFVGTTFDEWYFTVNELDGLDHLEGLEVDVLADGSYIGKKTVDSGAIDLTYQYGYVIAGLGYESRLDLPDINIPQQQLLFKYKNIPSIVLKVDKTKQFKIGTFQNNLEYTKYDLAPEFLEGKSSIQKINIPSNWSRTTEISIIRDTPVPLNINSVEYIFNIGGN